MFIRSRQRLRKRLTPSDIQQLVDSVNSEWADGEYSPSTPPTTEERRDDAACTPVTRSTSDGRTDSSRRHFACLTGSRGKPSKHAPSNDRDFLCPFPTGSLDFPKSYRERIWDRKIHSLMDLHGIGIVHHAKAAARCVATTDCQAYLDWRTRTQ